MKSLSGRLSRFPVSSLAVLLLSALPALNAQSNQGPTQQNPLSQTYMIGNVPILIPSPVPQLTEVGPDYRMVLEVLVPDLHRLVAAFTPPGADLTLKKKGPKALSEYALVEVLRQAESTDVPPADFNKLVDAVARQMGTLVATSRTAQETEVNRKLKGLNLDADALSADKPLHLGCLFSEPDAYGYGLVMPVPANGTTTAMVMGMSMVRTRNRVLFTYTYAAYKDQNTLKWIHSITEDWADAILSANRQ
jgi:hypothetical protein